MMNVIEDNGLEYARETGGNRPECLARVGVPIEGQTTQPITLRLIKRLVGRGDDIA